MDRHDTLLLACGTAENRKMLRSGLEESFNLLEAVNTGQAMLLLEQNINCIAAVILDITLPEAVDAKRLQSPEGMALLGQVPVIVITSDEDSHTLSTAFDYGAADVIAQNYDPYAMIHRIETIVELHLHKQQLEVLVQEQAEILRHSNDAMVDALSSIIEYRSVESGQHILRIRHFTKILLEELALCCPEYGLTDELIGIISSASALHDVGKISIPDAILTKPGKLTAEEMQIMRSHTLTGCHILQRMGDLVNQEYLRYAHNICHYHHERWDGGGYPEGLAGENIPICAQVVGLADVYDALTTKRVYKDAYSYDTAVNMILQGECGVFSPKLLECFKHVIDKYEALARAYMDGLAPESENFDVLLPTPSKQKRNDGMERTWAKYQALVHYVNVFLMELDLDQGLFHLIYNPYPEFATFHGVSNFAEIEQLVLNELVVPEQREEMKKFLYQGILNFIQEGLRRVNYQFRFRSRTNLDGESFELTLLRINPADSKHRSLAILCRKIEKADRIGAFSPEIPGADCTCRYDQDFTITNVGTGLQELTGFTPEEIQRDFGNRLSLLVHPEDRTKLRRERREQLQRGTGIRAEFRLLRKDGSYLWAMNSCRLVTGPDGQEYLNCNLTDISSARRREEELEKKLERYEIILAQTENVLFEWDRLTDRITFSDTWEKLFGFAPISRNVYRELMEGSYLHPDDIPMFLERIGNLERESDYEMMEVRIATHKGRYIWCRFRATAIRDEAGKLIRISGIIINIDAEKQAERALQDRAERDSLTKLLNKEASRRQAEEYFAQYAGKANCALLIIDLDDFKLVNDRYGHLFGDSVLTKAAREIKKLFRTQDIIARIGGDEFMVLMRGTCDRNLVENRCSRLISAFQTTFRNQHYQLPLSCSIGIALAPEHGSSYFDLYRCADQALYQAKNRGKNTFMFYDSSDSELRATPFRATAVSNHIDSDEEPGLADNNIVHYAFQRLYTSQNVKNAINDILTMIGRQMNVSRVYIFENSPDNRFCSNTYEWCNEGIPPEIDNLQNISYETDIPGYEFNFNEDGIFYCPDITVLPKKTYDIVAPQGIKSMLHCAIRDKGVFRGYIGFDECVTQRFWTKEQIQALTYFSEMLSVFLLKKQAQDRTVQQVAELTSILDNQNAWIYIIDPDTCKLKYLNAKTRSLAPDAAVGMTCHEALRGCPQRCENCPSAHIRKTKTDSVVLDNRKFGLHVLAEATLIQWEGQESCLLTCRELADAGMKETLQKSGAFAAEN